MSQLLRRVGARLKELRSHRGWTQEELAEAAGLSYKFVGEVERGTANPTLLTLEALCQALKVEVVDLLPSVYERRAISPHDKLVVREALSSIESIIGVPSPAPYPRRRRRHR